MKHDERIVTDIQRAESIGFKILRWGIFAVLLYRWFFLGETLAGTLDIFIVWLVASLAEFIIMATRGIPISYPVALTKREQLIFIFTVPLAAAFLPIIIMLINQSLEGFTQALWVYLRTYLILVVLFSGYKAIVNRWEKHYLE